MFRDMRCTRWIVAAAILVIAQSATETVQAQLFWDQQYQSRRAGPRSGGFFDNFFGPYNSRSRDDEYTQPRQRQYQRTQESTESSRAPPPPKTESKVAPATSIVVMGDDMADWLAYGLENVFSESPEIGIVRRNKLYSGLLRYDGKGDLDWWHVARDTLAQEKADYVVMMLGVSDRQDIREKDLVKEAETRARDEQAKDASEKKDGQKAVIQAGETGVAEAQPGNEPGGPADFRSERWAKIYSRRIDQTIAALKSKGVPVIWVGLPPIRGARSMADTAYLNELYRARAERAGIAYVDVWDGFVDEAGKYSNYGPDYEGQMRRLRLSDGAFFTKYGAVKLAHYVERELRRYMSNPIPVALPSEPVEPAPPGSKPVERPLAGPVVQLTGARTPNESDDLLGGPGDNTIRGGDATVTKVLRKGETVAAPLGRADNFAWPRGGESAQPTPVPPKPEAGFSSATSAMASAPAGMTQEERKKGAPGKKVTQKSTKAFAIRRHNARSPQDDVPRPPLPINPFGGASSWMR